MMNCVSDSNYRQTRTPKSQKYGDNVNFKRTIHSNDSLFKKHSSLSKSPKRNVSSYLKNIEQEIKSHLDGSHLLSNVEIMQHLQMVNSTKVDKNLKYRKQKVIALLKKLAAINSSFEKAIVSFQAIDPIEFTFSISTEKKVVAHGLENKIENRPADSSDDANFPLEILTNLNFEKDKKVESEENKEREIVENNFENINSSISLLQVNDKLEKVSNSTDNKRENLDQSAAAVTNNEHHFPLEILTNQNFQSVMNVNHVEYNEKMSRKKPEKLYFDTDNSLTLSLITEPSDDSSSLVPDSKAKNILINKQENPVNKGKQKKQMKKVDNPLNDELSRLLERILHIDEKCAKSENNFLDMPPKDAKKDDGGPKINTKDAKSLTKSFTESFNQTLDNLGSNIMGESSSWCSSPESSTDKARSFSKGYDSLSRIWNSADDSDEEDVLDIEEIVKFHVKNFGPECEAEVRDLIKTNLKIMEEIAEEFRNDPEMRLLEAEYGNDKPDISDKFWLPDWRKIP